MKWRQYIGGDGPSATTEAIVSCPMGYANPDGGKRSLVKRIAIQARLPQPHAGSSFVGAVYQCGERSSRLRGYRDLRRSHLALRGFARWWMVSSSTGGRPWRARISLLG